MQFYFRLQRRPSDFKRGWVCLACPHPPKMQCSLQVLQLSWIFVNTDDLALLRNRSILQHISDFIKSYSLHFNSLVSNFCSDQCFTAKIRSGMIFGKFIHRSSAHSPGIPSAPTPTPPPLQKQKQKQKNTHVRKGNHFSRVQNHLHG